MSSSNVITDCVAAVLKEAGFRRKSTNWYLDTTDAVLVTNLQKSIFGAQYYLNFAVWLRALGSASMPKEQNCHIRIRATILDSDRHRHLERSVFDLDHPMSDEDRKATLRFFLESTALPFLRSCGTLSGLRQLSREGQLEGAGITIEAQRLLAG